MTLDTAMQTIQALLNDEKQRGAIHGAEDLARRQAQRATIREQIQYLEHQLAQVKEQVRTLPKVPPQATIQWAQAVRTLLNLVFLEVDTTGLDADAEIIRICVLPNFGNPLTNVLVKPSQSLPPLITTLTGISNDQVQRWGVPLSSALGQLRAALNGRYVLSYNLEFDLGKLREATQRTDAQEITVIGEDLMTQAMRYFSLTSYPKLEDLCKRIEQPLPDHPHQTILDRARGQQHLLAAMAQVITGPANTQAAPTSDEETSDDEDGDEHPF